MASHVPESSEIIESSLAPVAPTPRLDLSLSKHTPAHRVTSVVSLWTALSQISQEFHRRLWDSLLLTILASFSPVGRNWHSYSTMSKGYQCNDPVSKHLFHSLDVTFLEDVPFFVGTPSLLGLDAETIPTDLDELPRPIPLFDSPSVQVPPASAARPHLEVYPHRAPPSAPLPDSSSVSGTSPSHLVSTSVSPRYPSRTRHPLDRFGFSSFN
ncbi:hypothetical protein Acr_14g0005610 [Actinidia rufa]|uniref:Uncharacterized protein n=1 Tax=Actinidia rufa TaxID=165716 RepID=A0A7J0FQD0_9ERIC|nr:hypothetical protein Acr_14g0005610 [Actinidia rufa]